MLLSIDGTFLLQILNFVVFWTLLNYVFIRPTRRAIEARQRAIDEVNRAAEEMRKRAEALKAQAESLLDGARRRSDELLRAGAARAADEADAISRGAVGDAAASVQLAHATVAAERAAAVAKQGPLVAELARAMVAKATDLESVA
jgi:F-type H+-transporting ATPase subunit b